jgi:hypothetical protein
MLCTCSLLVSIRMFLISISISLWSVQVIKHLGKEAEICLLTQLLSLNHSSYLTKELLMISRQQPSFLLSYEQSIIYYEAG